MVHIASTLMRHILDHILDLALPMCTNSLHGTHYNHHRETHILLGQYIVGTLVHSECLQNASAFRMLTTFREDELSLMITSFGEPALFQLPPLAVTLTRLYKISGPGLLLTRGTRTAERDAEQSNQVDCSRK